MDKASVKQLISSINEIKEAMVTKDDLTKLIATIQKQQDHIDKLESQVSILQNSVNLLKKDKEIQEQYLRRQCVRILGVPKQKERETEEDCLSLVNNIVTTMDMPIPEDCIDRAHRVGRAENGKPPAIIVKFSTYKHRTIFYKRRKDILHQKQFLVHLDLTKERQDLLRQARQYVMAHRKSDDDFIFADINCFLTLKVAGRFHKVFSIEDVQNIIQAR